MTSLRTMTAAFVLALGIAPASATELEQTTTIRIARPTEASPAAIHQLKQRIAAAALEVCGASAGDLAEVRRAIAHSDCWRTSYAAALAQIDRGPDHAADAALSLLEAGNRP